MRLSMYGFLPWSTYRSSVAVVCVVISTRVLLGRTHCSRPSSVAFPYPAGTLFSVSTREMPLHGRVHMIF